MVGDQLPCGEILGSPVQDYLGYRSQLLYTLVDIVIQLQLTCAFVPPKPKQLTLTRFFALAGQGCAARDT